jgi:transposase InsO family protein
LGDGSRQVGKSPANANEQVERWMSVYEDVRCCPFVNPFPAKRLIQQYVDRYNYLRLHSAIGYVTPKDMLAWHQQEI